jgi:Tfp pilus assembly protein PilZ
LNDITSKKPRKIQRKACLIQVDFAVKDRFFSGFISDISISGAFIEGHSIPSVGDQISLTFLQPDFPKPFKLDGEVVRTSPKGFGVKFKKFNPVQNEMIDALVDRIKGGWL